MAATAAVPGLHDASGTNQAACDAAAHLTAASQMTTEQQAATSAQLQAAKQLHQASQLPAVVTEASNKASPERAAAQHSPSARMHLADHTHIKQLSDSPSPAAQPAHDRLRSSSQEDNVWPLHANGWHAATSTHASGSDSQAALLRASIKGPGEPSFLFLLLDEDQGITAVSYHVMQSPCIDGCLSPFFEAVVMLAFQPNPYMTQTAYCLQQAEMPLQDTLLISSRRRRTICRRHMLISQASVSFAHAQVHACTTTWQSCMVLMSLAVTPNINCRSISSVAHAECACSFPPIACHANQQQRQLLGSGELGHCLTRTHV